MAISKAKLATKQTSLRAHFIKTPRLCFLLWLPLELLQLVMQLVSMEDLKSLRLSSKYFRGVVTSLVIQHATIEDRITKRGVLLDFVTQPKAPFIEHININIHRYTGSLPEHFSYHGHPSIKQFFEGRTSLKLVPKIGYEKTSDVRHVKILSMWQVSSAMRMILGHGESLQILHLDLQWARGLLVECFYKLTLPSLRRLQLRRWATTESQTCTAIGRFSATLRYVDLFGWEVSSGHWIAALTKVAQRNKHLKCKHYLSEYRYMRQEVSKEQRKEFDNDFGDRFKEIEKDDAAPV